MRTPDAISKDGFTTTELDEKLDLVLVAAHLALRSYCATPHALSGRMHLTKPGSNNEDQMILDYNLGYEYRRSAYQTIVHFQHFAELVVKQALREDHELLVVLTGKHHEHLHRLLHGDPVDPNAAQAINTIEFSEALSRCCTLLTSHRLRATGYDYILGFRSFLETINSLRNRLWHRGTYVLRYRALDELIGGYGLPFLRETMAHTRFAGRERVWKHGRLACGLDPLQLIEAEMTSTPCSFEKIAFLKEVARAAYENPLIEDSQGWFDDENKATTARAQSAASAVTTDVHEVTECPVCGIASHAVYSSWNEDANDCPVDFTYKSRCFCCGLELYSEYGNPSDHGFAQLRDYWKRI